MSPVPTGTFLSMRFLHLADVHLDTPFAGRTETLRRRLREAAREALRAAFDTALAQEVDAVLIAGDLFDGPRLTFQTERFLVEQFRRLESGGVTLVYATGNHDPGHSGLRAHGLPWPAQVVVVGGRTPRRVPIRRSGEAVGWVTAAGHETARETADLSQAFTRPPGELPEVALLHTQVRSARFASEHDAYAPSELEHLRRAGYDYWALGHVHTRQQLSEDPHIHYPGNLQGRTPKESGVRGGLLVDLSDRAAPLVRFLPFGPVRWETFEVSGIEEADSLARLVRQVENGWREHLEQAGPGPEEAIVRVRLRGPCPLAHVLSTEEERTTLAQEVQDAIGALDVTVEVEGLLPAVPLEEYRRREDVLGEALRLVAEVREGGELPSVDPGELAAYETNDPDRPAAYLRDLLEGAEGEILAKLLRPEGR